SYDGFGNMKEVDAIRGTVPTFCTGYDSKNHAGGEDLNGKPGTVPLPAYATYASATYDVENRLTLLCGSLSPNAAYSYAPGNKRVWRGTWSGGTQTTDEVTFWSVSGQKLAAYALSLSGSTLIAI